MKQKSFLAAVLIGALAFGLGLWVRTTYWQAPAFTHGISYPEPKAVPEVVLVGGDGKAARLGDFAGKYVWLFFGYTSCPDVCPTSLANIAGEINAMGPAAEQVQVVFVSVDPQRDTPSEIGRYAKFYHPSFLGMTGPRGELDRLTKGVGAYYFLGVDAEAGKDDYEVTHSSSVYVLNPAGKLVAVYSGDGKPGRLAQDFNFLDS